MAKTSNSSAGNSSAGNSSAGKGWFDSKAPMAGMQDYMMSLPHMFAVSTKAMLNHQKEMLSFMTARCEQQMRLVDQISGAREAKEILDAVVSFGQSAAKHYSSEVSKVAELTSDSASAAMDGIRHEAQVAVEATTKGMGASDAA